jgi:hypothetical protein
MEGESIWRDRCIWRERCIWMVRKIDRCIIKRQLDDKKT